MNTVRLNLKMNLKYPQNTREAAVRSEHEFLRHWRQTSSRDTACMLRASLLRRTNPALVKEAETAKEPALDKAD